MIGDDSPALEETLAKLICERFGPTEGSGPGVSLGEAQWLASRWMAALAEAPQLLGAPVEA